MPERRQHGPIAGPCPNHRGYRPRRRRRCRRRRLRPAVAPGGLLLAVYNDLDHEHLEHMKSRGVDPADYVGAADLRRLLDDDSVIESHAVEARIQPPPGTPHVADLVLRARRR